MASKKKTIINPIFSSVGHFDMLDKFDDLSRVPDHLRPRIRLTVVQGLRGTFCLEFKTTGKECMKKHMSMNHKVEKELSKTDGVESVALQSWHQGRHY